MHAASATQSTKLQVCRPKTSEHRRAMKWFSSLTRIVDRELAADETDQAKDDRTTLQHSMQLFGIYVESGEKSYLDLCEDFLKHTL